MLYIIVLEINEVLNFITCENHKKVIYDRLCLHLYEKKIQIHVKIIQVYTSFYIVSSEQYGMNLIFCGKFKTHVGLYNYGFCFALKVFIVV